MLIKLLKYDLKSMLKTIVPFWIGALLISAIFGVVNIVSTDSNSGMMMVFLFGLTLFCLFVAVVVVNFLLIIQRFWNGLLKEEGYLMFTIPTTPRMLILSKVLSSTIVSIGTILVAYLSVLLAMTIYTSVVDGTYLTAVMDLLTHPDFKDIFEIITFVVTIIINGIQKIYVFYLSMAVGHLSNKNRFLCSFGAFIGINIVIGMISAVFYQIGSYVESLNYFSTAMKAFWSVNVLCIILIIVTHIATEYILTKKLNLE